MNRVLEELIPSPDLGGIRISDRFDRRADRLPDPPGGSGGGEGPRPFDVLFGTPSGGSVAATVQPGTINGLLPSNYSSSWTLTIPGTYFVVLSCTASGGQITGATLNFNSSPPAGIPVNSGQPPLSFDFLLGIVVDGVWFRTIGDGSLTAAGQLSYQVNATAPAPGTLPFTNYYTWVIAQA